MNELNQNTSPECPALPSSFFERDTVEVAQQLLGCYLWKFIEAEQQWLRFKIVETEAYTQADPACHAYERTTGRAEILYREPGTAYVYLIYGMYNCLNVVTEAIGTAGAVLFRALEPPAGTPYKTNGPGRLTKALNISRQQFNGILLTQPHHGLFLSAGEPIASESVVQCPRIGITKAVDYPWRFYIAGNAWVSVKAKNKKEQLA